MTADKGDTLILSNDPSHTAGGLHLLDTPVTPALHYTGGLAVPPLHGPAKLRHALGKFHSILSIDTLLLIITMLLIPPRCKPTLGRPVHLVV